jgi:hypothetical protein
MQTQPTIFLNRAMELENRAAKHNDGTLKFTLLKLAAYYRQLSEQATNMNESESRLPEALIDFV